MHLNDGQLRASLDHEGSTEEIRHVEDCAVCQKRLAEIQQKKEHAGRVLSFLADGMDRQTKQVPSAAYELAHLKETAIEKENRMQNLLKFLKNRFVWGSATTILLVGAFISVPTMRAAAAEILALFRVQKVAALPLDPTGLNNFTGDSNLSEKLSQVISDSVVETKKAGELRVVSNVEEASQSAGFSVRLPGSESEPPVLYVQDSMAFEINIDREKAQTFINETGRTDIVLPENVDGKQVKVEIPAGMTATFGECPRPDEEAEQIDPDEPASTGRVYPECAMLSVVPSPLVSAPEDLDVGQLVQLGLEFSGMSADEAQQLRDSIDWTSTLVIPIPSNASRYEQVDVDGVSGILIQRQVDLNPHYLLVWVKDGVIYSISGWGTDTSRALEMANTLQ
ncbi:MAG: hypothetical protein AB9891_09760 [Anaerolineaceae bacterium]